MCLRLAPLAPLPQQLFMHPRIRELLLGARPPPADQAADNLCAQMQVSAG